MGDALERIVRECAAQAARSGRRVTLRATIRGAEVDVAVEYYATIQPKLSIGRLLARLQAGSG